MTLRLLKQRLPVIGYSLFVLIYFFLLANTETVAGGVVRGMNIAVTAVIPSLFFFYILSDAWLSVFLRANQKENGWFSRCFRLPEIGAAPFLIGAISGFPIGAKVVARLYTEERITKDDAVRLVAFSNNTGPAFLIGGIGVSLLGDARIGILLYVSQMIAAVLYGVIGSLGKPLPEKKNRKTIPVKPFSLVGSIGSAGGAMLSIAAFVVFFQTVLSTVDLLFDAPAVTVLLSLFLEIGNAAATVSPLYPIMGRISVGMLAFSVAFGGLSVHMQSAHIWKETRLPYFRHVIIPKLLQGLLSGSIAFFTYPVLF